ncbi:hypothetical protein BAY61_26915 [Prauserella marina]|uniref:Uncharacterized protein n=1 Tax=Prauserella marina TaxID=530584 RepID=A0A222VW36_9PSEU|nr:hypothetical protein [Prauserella marina]ASR38042.1 hypothetical protein BAY61_26915 [Prauserella marina]PWV73279.1 hypothetical protein DES30_109230 [Prauserella marina]SDD67461.1 hypothetical protein SAMN05421630_11143 [Prauserella marina]
MNPDPFDHPGLRELKRSRWEEYKARRLARKARRRQVAIWGQPQRRFRHARTVGVVVALAAIVAGGAYALDQYRDTRPPGSYADLAVSAVDETKPFVNTPAQDWADAADGIVLPKAVAVGGFSAEQVERALADVKAVLVASRLERAMLEKGDYEPFLKLLAPETRGWLRKEFKKDIWPSSVATRVAEGSRLLPLPAKVKGSIVVAAGERAGELRVRTNYVFAYAFAGDGSDRIAVPLDIVAMQRVDVSFIVYEVGSGRNDGIYYERFAGFDYSMSCSASKKGLLAPSYLEPRAMGVPAEEGPREYFDPERAVEIEDGCADV